MEKIEILNQNQVDVASALELWGDMASYQEALTEYKDSLPSKLRDLETDIQENNWNEYAVLAHSMKSEAKYLGFMKHAETFLEHELKGKAADGSFIKENYKELRHVAEEIIHIILEYFGEKKNLLVADDSNIILNFIEKNVKEDYNVLKAEDGKSAIELLKQNQVYGMLLDLNMPNQNGFEVLEYLKEKELLSEIPVIIITGDDETKTIDKAFSYHVLNVLKKPFNDNNIKSALETIKNFYQKNTD